MAFFRRLNQRRGAAWLADVALALLLAAGLVLRVLPDYARMVDVALFDETRYIYWAMRWREGLPLQDVFRARLYVLWYAGLARLWPDPLALHDANFRLLVTLVPVLLYGVLRTHRVPRRVAWPLAWFFALSDVNLGTRPLVSHLAWAVVLLGYLAFLRLPNPWRWPPLLWATALASHARPEFVLALGLLVVMALVQARASLSTRAGRGALVATLVGLLALYAALGSPLDERGRFFVAFGQHFAYRWRKVYGVEGGVWDRWQAVRDRAFGPDVRSFPQAVLRNPKAVARHVVRNLLEAPPRLALMLWTHVPVLLPLWEEAALAGLLTLGLLAYLAWRRCLPLRGPEPAVWAVLLLPSLVSMAVIFPRQHYALGVALAGALALGVGLRRCLARRGAAASLSRDVRDALALAGLLLALAPPLAARYPCRDPATFLRFPLPQAFYVRECATTEVRESLLALRSLQRVYPSFTLVVDPNLWVQNMEVYLRPGIRPVFKVLRAPQSARGEDVVLAHLGGIWVKEPGWWERLRALQQEYGVLAYCTRGQPWVFLLRLQPPPDFPLQPCQPRFAR